MAKKLLLDPIPQSPLSWHFRPSHSRYTVYWPNHSNAKSFQLPFLDPMSVDDSLRVTNWELGANGECLIAQIRIVAAHKAPQSRHCWCACRCDGSVWVGKRWCNTGHWSRVTNLTRHSPAVCGMASSQFPISHAVCQQDFVAYPSANHTACGTAWHMVVRMCGVSQLNCGMP